MKPPPFDYIAPGSLPEALSVLAEWARRGDEAKVLAGGQSLVPLLNFRLAAPAVLIDLNRVGELAYVRSGRDGGLAIGAMTRQRRLEQDPEVARWAPLVAEAAPWIAHPQIRNRGTVGGSLAHADPAAELPAVAVALDARFRLASEEGTRELAAADFYVGLLATALQPGEILAEVFLPSPPPHTGCAFLELARRRGDYAQVGVAAVLTRGDDDRCTSARLVLLAVGEAPVTAARAAGLLTGEVPGDELFAAAADLVADEEIEPVADVHATADYKRQLARVLARRALARAWQRATEPPGTP